MMQYHDSGMSYTEVLLKISNGQASSETPCGDCTACCKIFDNIPGVNQIPGTMTCEKLCEQSSRCTIYAKRPEKCKGYTCLHHYASGMILDPLRQKNGKHFVFRIDTDDDYIAAVMMALTRHVLILNIPDLNVIAIDLLSMSTCWTLHDFLLDKKRREKIKSILPKRERHIKTNEDVLRFLHGKKFGEIMDVASVIAKNAAKEYNTLVDGHNASDRLRGR